MLPMKRSPPSRRGTASAKAPPPSSRAKVRAHRQRQRAKGLRPVQFWLPDVHSARFIKEARRQSVRAAHSASEHSDQAFVDAIADWT
jgi:hypothetical protein